MIIRAYSQDYLNDVVENQGKLFDFVAQTYPDKDTEDFIKTYMTSKTRKSIDEAKAYVNTMDAKELWEYFTETEKYSLKSGKALDGFCSSWWPNRQIFCAPSTSLDACMPDRGSSPPVQKSPFPGRDRRSR